MRAKRSKKEAITREEIIQAMNEFLIQGGKITQLPAQKVVHRQLKIGTDKYEAYENWQETSYVM